MKINEFRNWINNLPEDFDDYSIVFREYGKLDENHNYGLDKPIVTVTIDEDSNELVILDEDSRKELEKLEKE